MQWGIPVLTSKGREAMEHPVPELTARCRNVLVQVDGKKTVEDIHRSLEGLEGIEESLEKLVSGEYIDIRRDCKDLVKALAERMLGIKAQTLIKKVDEMHARYGDDCWEHLDELDKTARLFYGEVVAEDIKNQILQLVSASRN